MVQEFAPEFPRDLSHLKGTPAPAISFHSTQGGSVSLRNIRGTAVVFVQPGSSAALHPREGWLDELKRVPGAAGCTGQCKAFSNDAGEFKRLNVAVYGLSGQTLPEQLDVCDKLGLEIPLLSDAQGMLLAALRIRAVRLPDPNRTGTKLSHPRFTLIIKDGTIIDAIVPERSPEGVAGSSALVLARVDELNTESLADYLAKNGGK